MLSCRSDKAGEPLDTGTVQGTDPDSDGDGFTASEDCNDSDAAISPSSEEICDGIDNNCDGSVDEGVTDVFYADSDGDSFGDPLATVDSCEAPDGHVPISNDCDDGDADIFPGAPERCNGLDDDCDGETDEDVLSTWHADADGDGYGAPDATLDDCDPPLGYVSNAEDCDDLNDSAFPGGTEVCDEADNNCDGAVDELVTTTFYQDTDGDGYGLADVTTDDCDLPTGYAPVSGDCDDGDRAINPSSAEICDGADNDCDGVADGEDAVDAQPFYADGDGDGYGDDDSIITACEAPSGHVEDSGDCDDLDDDSYPGASEVCDEADNDCDGATDEDATDAQTFYGDSDGDGYGGDRYTTSACSAPTGYVDNSGDCDDLDAGSYPGASEVCDEADNDCDGAIDEDATDAQAAYADSDGDGYGDPDSTTEACAPPSGYVDNSGDCDDLDGDSYPGASEVCDEADNDCDGDTDEDATDAQTFHADSDGDGYGDVRDTVDRCLAPSGYVSDDTDCDDGATAVYPGAAEVCDGIDNDCDRETDEDADDAETFYADLDGDGFGTDELTSTACAAPSGFVSADGDCDESDGAINPDAEEVCDGVDNDCDGTVDGSSVGALSTFYLDSDLDGYGDPAVSVEDCEEPSGYVSNADDCDDSSADASPTGTEVCDGLDNDCDGSVDNEELVYGDAADCAALSCQDIISTRPDAEDGTYVLDLYGDGSDVTEAFCEMTFEDGGWLAVFNWMDPGTSSTSDAADLYAALTSNADMTGSVQPDATSTDIFTANLPLGDYTEVVYGWASSSSADVTRYGTYATATLVGECYVDGYCGNGVSIATMDVVPTGSSRTFYTGNVPTYPHVGIGWSGQIIVWGYDLNSSSYGHWGNWYDTKSCCTSGNTSDMTGSDWRYVIYIR
jgi:hypothetical protein